MLAFFFVSLSVAIFLTTGWLNKSTWWILPISSVFQGTFMGLMVPARNAIIREIVDRDQLMNAVSLNAMGGNVFQILAPAATGFLIDSFGFKAVFYIMSAFYVLGAIFILFMPRTSKFLASSKNTLRNMAEGFKYILRNRDLFFVIIFTYISMVLAMPHQQLLPVFVDKRLHVGATGMGILVSVSGIGALVGSLTLASLPNRKRGLIMLAGTLGLSLALIVFAFSKSWPLSIGIMILVGLGLTVRLTLSNTLAQHFTSDEYRGRVMGTYDMQMPLTGLSIYLMGALTESIGVQWAVGGSAMLLAMICLSALFFIPRLRKLE